MGKKRYPWPIILCLLVFLRAETSQGQIFRVCYYDGFPLTFRNADGNPSGLFVEILNGIAREERWSLQYRHESWENCLNALRNDDVDLVLAIAENEDRVRFSRFSRETVLTNWGVLFSAKGRSVQSIMELQGKHIAVLRSDVYGPPLMDLLNRFHIEVRYTEVPSYDTVMAMVESGRADLGLTNRIFGTFAQKRYAVQPTPIVVHPVELKFAASLNAPATILSAIDHHVQQWKTDEHSPLYQAMSRWLHMPAETAHARILESYLYLTLGTVLVLGTVAFFLRRQLRLKGRHVQDVHGRLDDAIAKHRATQAALAEAENWYRAVFEKANDALLILNEQGRILECNPAACRFFKAGVSDIVGQTPMQLSPEVQPDGESSDRKGKVFLDATLSGCPQRFDWVHKTKNGQSISTEVQLSLLFESGEARVLACIRDVSQHKALENEQEKQRQYLQTVLDGVPVALFVIDLEGNVVFWNRMCETITGMSQKEVIGRPLTLKPVLEGKDLPIPALLLLDMTVDELLEQHPDWQAQPLPFHSEGLQLTGKITVRGEKRHMSIVAARLRDRAGEMLGVIQCARDITQEVHMQKQLLHSQKMEAVGRLSAGIAHDFNNILTIILGYCDLIRHKNDLDPSIKKRVDEIEKTAERAANLTRQLLVFSRKQVMQPVPLNMNQLIQDLSPMLQRAVGEDIDLHRDLAEDLWPVYGDPVFLEQILLNLVINARDAMPKGGRIAIETWNQPLTGGRDLGHFTVKPGNYVCLRVSDNGHGMTPEVQQRIFEPFFTTKAEGRGTGLGLATVYGIVKRLGGYILVESAVGQGTAFEILFPKSLKEPEQTHKRSSKAVKGSHSGETILVVEDEDSLRAMVYDVLRGVGYHVITAASGAEALQTLGRAPKIHLVITDVVMPEMDGVTLSRQLAQVLPEVPVLFISGYTDDQLAHRGILLPEVHFLAKPFNADQLLWAVRNLLDRKSQATA